MEPQGVVEVEIDEEEDDDEEDDDEEDNDEEDDEEGVVEIDFFVFLVFLADLRRIIISRRTPIHKKELSSFKRVTFCCWS